MAAPLDAADHLNLDARIVAPSDWTYPGAKGVCSQPIRGNCVVVKVKDRANTADLASTLIHDYAHALLHSQIEGNTERAKRDVEPEAVAYVVGRYFGLDTSNAAFHLATWIDDDTAVITDRLQRISRTATELVDIVERQPSQSS